MENQEVTDYKSCPRCDGNIINGVEKKDGNRYQKCFQCGYYQEFLRQSSIDTDGGISYQDETTKEITSNEGSLDMRIRILDAFNNDEEALSISEIARKSGLDQSKVANRLDSLKRDKHYLEDVIYKSQNLEFNIGRVTRTALGFEVVREYMELIEEVEEQESDDKPTFDNYLIWSSSKDYTEFGKFILESLDIKYKALRNFVRHLVKKPRQKKS
jgi:DNA-binding Lrp family transcriptional regulator